MALASTLSNIKITNNIVDVGYFSDGASPVNYTYNRCMLLNGSANVEGNTFSGCIGGSTGSTDLISVSGGSSKFHHNTFIRGSSSLNSYINITSTTDQIITDNFFDNSTVDGTDDVIVSGLSTTSIYEKNKNQIVYIPIPLTSFTTNVNPTNVNLHNSTLAYARTDISSIYAQFTIAETGTRIFRFNSNLNSFLPDDIRILEAKMGAYGFNAGATLSAGNNYFFYSLVSSDVVVGNYSSGVNSMLDAKNNYDTSTQLVSLSDYDMEANLAALTSNAQYVTLDVSSSSNFIANKNTALSLIFFAQFNLTVAGSFALSVSPIILKCVW